MLIVLCSSAPLQVFRLVVTSVAILVVDLGMRLSRRRAVEGSADEAVHQIFCIVKLNSAVPRHPFVTVTHDTLSRPNTSLA